MEKYDSLFILKAFLPQALIFFRTCQEWMCCFQAGLVHNDFILSIRICVAWKKSLFIRSDQITFYLSCGYLDSSLSSFPKQLFNCSTLLFLFSFSVFSIFFILFCRCLFISSIQEWESEPWSILVLFPLCIAITLLC